LNFLKFIKLNKLTNKVASDISAMFKILVPDLSNPSIANMYDIKIYKHQLKFLKFLIGYNKLFLLKSKLIGGTTISSLYVLYLCKSLKNQNIFIHSPNMMMTKKILLSLLSDEGNINFTPIGIDLIEYNSNITFIDDTEIKQYSQQLSQFNDSIFIFDDFNENQISLMDLLPIFKSKNKVIIISNSPMNGNGNKIWENKIGVKFQTLLLSTFKISYTKK